MMMAEQELEYQASVERLSDVEKKLAVEVPWEQVKGRLEDAYRELGRGVSVKGFRKGKVPRKMLQNLFGEHVNREVAQRLVQDSIILALKDKELSPVSEPQVDDDGIVDGEAFRYSAVLQVVPEVEVKDYFGVEVAQRPSKVDEAEIDQALAAKQRELTEYKPIEDRVTAHGDVLLVDYMGKLDGKPIDEENKLIELGETPVEPLAGLAAHLTGIELEGDDELDIELEIPPMTEEGAPQQAQLLVTVKDAKQKVVPALDDDLAKASGEADTLDELKESLRKKLLEADEQRAKGEARQRMINAILERNDVPVVPALVDQHINRVLQLQAQLMGIDPRSISGMLDDEKLKDSLRTDAERTVQGALLIEAVAKAENVEVQEADLEKRLAEHAKERGENVAKVRSEYEKQGRLEQLRASLREEKTLDLLMSKANLTVREIEPDEAGENEASESDAPEAADAEKAAEESQD
jgi:trigger factor